MAIYGPDDHRRSAALADSCRRRALRSYRRAHRFIDRYDALGRREALAQPPSTLQRAVRTAAVTDPDVSRRLATFAMRAADPSVLLNPKVAVRAFVRSGVRRSRGATSVSSAGRSATSRGRRSDGSSPPRAERVSRAG